MLVKMTEDFEQQLSPLTTRKLPKGWVGDLDDATARAAIKAKKATPVADPKPEKGKGE